ncbi:MAG: LysM peptidoglycan-binding domain-containing protein [Nitrospirota bacterium]
MKLRHILFLNIFLSIFVCGYVWADEINLKGAEKKKHTVADGDTLWDLSSVYLKDPFLWREIWKLNRFIDNPDLIYPGQTIYLPLLEEEKIEIEEAKEEEIEEEIPLPVDKEEEIQPEKEQPRTVPLHAKLIESSGYILSDTKAMGVVAGSKDKKTILGEMDTIYLTPPKGLEIGERVTIYRNVKKVFHPVTKRYLGDLIKILGIADITNVHEKVAEAIIKKSHDYILKEDSFIPYKPIISEIEEEMTASDSSKIRDMKGYIVELKDDKSAGSTSDIVYIDKGRKDGVTRGDHFLVKKGGHSLKTGLDSPERVIGELEVLSVQERTATAMVIKSYSIIQTGSIISR